MSAPPLRPIHFPLPLLASSIDFFAVCSVGVLVLLGLAPGARARDNELTADNRPWRRGRVMREGATPGSYLSLSRAPFSLRAFSCDARIPLAGGVHSRMLRPTARRYRDRRRRLGPGERSLLLAPWNIHVSASILTAISCWVVVISSHVESGEGIRCDRFRQICSYAPPPPCTPKCSASSSSH